MATAACTAPGPSTLQAHRCQTLPLAWQEVGKIGRHYHPSHCGTRRQQGPGALYPHQWHPREKPDPNSRGAGQARPPPGGHWSPPGNCVPGKSGVCQGLVSAHLHHASTHHRRELGRCCIELGCSVHSFRVTMSGKSLVLQECLLGTGQSSPLWYQLWKKKKQQKMVGYFQLSVMKGTS